MVIHWKSGSSDLELSDLETRDARGPLSQRISVSTLVKLDLERPNFAW